MLARKSNWAECPMCGEEYYWLVAHTTPTPLHGGLSDDTPAGCHLCRRAVWRWLAVRINWIGMRAS